ncbi:MAG: hypothetical protein HQL47_05575 [Gammaproteobacteria bacterium]|nr:hypothetical protein [Gammaproteobacteria bacterium]
MESVAKPADESAAELAKPEQASPFVVATEADPEALASAAMARSRAPCRRFESVGVVWQSGSTGVKTSGLGADKSVLNAAHAKHRGLGVATPAELWPGLIPRSVQQINQAAQPQPQAEIEPELPVLDQALAVEVLQPAEIPSAPPLMEDQVEAQAEAPVEMAPETSAEPMAEPIAEASAEPAPIVEPEPAQSHQHEPVQPAEQALAEPVAAPIAQPIAEQDLEVSTPAAEVLPAPEPEPELAEDGAQSEAESLRATAEWPDGQVTEIEWLGMDQDEEAEAGPEEAAVMHDKSSWRYLESALDDQGLEHSLDQLSTAVESLDEELRTVAPVVMNKIQPENRTDMSGAEDKPLLAEDEEFNPDDHPEFASVLDNVEATRPVPLVARQIEAAKARAIHTPEIPVSNRQEVPVESLFAGVAGTIGSGLSSVAKSGRYAVLGVKYCAEDTNALMGKMASLFKRKKAEEPAKEES